MNRDINRHAHIGRVIVMIAAATLLLTACGKATEVLTEKAIEAQTGGNVDISDDGDSISFESEDGSGSISVQSDDNGETGTISGTDAEGNEFSTNVGGSEIPDGFPLPIFEPSEVKEVITTETSGGSSYIAILEIAEGGVDEALAFYNDWFAAQGMEITILEIGLGSLSASSDTVAAQATILDGPPFQLNLLWTPIG